jgi:hypothetical protein
MKSFGFIITRHVNSESTNRYWNQSIKLLQKIYSNCKIIIIDDNSNPKFIKSDNELENMENIKIINSEFTGRGELLPYYYFIKNKFFDNAIILHDSVFFHKRINFEILKGHQVLPIWHFNSDRENINQTLFISKYLKNSFDLQKKLALNDNIIGMPNLKWFGCFGSQCYINHEFLLNLEKKYNFTNLINVIKTRLDRCCLERIIGCIFFSECSSLFKIKSLFGDIMLYQKWSNYNFDKYIFNLKNGFIPKPIVKVWTGR